MSEPESDADAEERKQHGVYHKAFHDELKALAEKYLAKDGISVHCLMTEMLSLSAWGAARTGYSKEDFIRDCSIIYDAELARVQSLSGAQRRH